LLEDLDALLKALEVAGFPDFNSLRREGLEFDASALMVKLALHILDELVEVAAHSDSVCDFNSFGSLRVPGSCVGRVKAA
jgi:hypothetical protein